MMQDDPTRQAPFDPCGPEPAGPDARALLAALRGEPAPLRVVAAAATHGPADLGAVEILDGASSLVDKVHGAELAVIYARTTAGNGAAHTAGDRAVEEWVVQDPAAFLAPWATGTELRFTSASDTQVEGNKQLLESLHAESAAGGGPLLYARLDVAYQGFPSKAAVDALKGNEPVGAELQFYKLTTRVPGKADVEGGRLLRERVVGGAGAPDVLTEHWLLSDRYVFPSGDGAHAVFDQAQYPSRYAFFDSARKQTTYTKGLYVQVTYSLGALPPIP